jgi:DNA segregation ATPase FtsK/SpoIIIE, S-DNA-T family
MLYADGAGGMMRVHGAYVSSEEIESVTGSLREQGAPQYSQSLMDDLGLSGTSRGQPAPPRETTSRTGRVTVAATSEDALYDRATAIIARESFVSITHLQQRLSISPGWAATLLRRLEADGVIGPPGHDGRCPVLVGRAA